MRKYKLLSWVLSLVMALTVFSIPVSGYATGGGGDDTEYFLGYWVYNDNSGEGTFKSIHAGDTVKISELGEKNLDVCFDGDSIYGAEKIIVTNDQSKALPISYYNYAADETITSTEKVTTIPGYSFNLEPREVAGKANISVAVYDSEGNTVATIKFTVDASSEEMDALWLSRMDLQGNIAVGGQPFTWAAGSNEEDEYAEILVDTLDSDKVVRLSVDSAGPAWAYLYELGDEESIANAWFDEYGESHAEAVMLKAGKKYYIHLYRDDIAVKAKVSLTVNPVQDIQYHFNKTFYENVGGSWATAEDGQKYFEYDCYYDEGDTLTLVDAAGNKDVYTCKRTNQDDEYYLVFFNKNGDKINMDELQVGANDQEKNHWKLGAGNVFYVEYQGFRVEDTVAVEENPIASVKVVAAEQYKVAEDYYEIEKGANGKNYHRFYLPYWNEGDKITIGYKDGKTKTYVLSFDQKGYDVWKQVGGTEILNDEELSLASDQETKHWNGKVGATNTFYAVYMGVKSNGLIAKIVRSLGKAKVTLTASSLVYTGKARKPTVKTMKYGTTTLKKGTHYAFDYCDKAIGVGNYYIGFRGIGNYGGYKEVQFKVIPKGAAILKPKAAKKAITVKWKKQATKMKYQNENFDTNSGYITGYQVQYGLKSNFKGATTKTVKGYKKTSLTIKKLKGKKKYYVRVRTYMKIKGVGTFYSKWGAKKAVTTKK